MQQKYESALHRLCESEKWDCWFWSVQTAVHLRISWRGSLIPKRTQDYAETLGENSIQKTLRLVHTLYLLLRPRTLTVFEIVTQPLSGWSWKFDVDFCWSLNEPRSPGQEIWCGSCWSLNELILKRTATLASRYHHWFRSDISDTKIRESKKDILIW